ncbi:MAG TPA: hypothetical protein VFY29_02425, partial [Terriglobia bacterium]|nr:hypothetical protein [Terriglobia bacterium]
MTRSRTVFALAAALVAAAACTQPENTPPKSEIKTGTIRGVVRLDGAAPVIASLPTKQDQDTCGASVPTVRLTLGKDSGVQDAFVYLDGAPAGTPPTKTKSTASVLIDQEKCQYKPHALIVRTGSTVEMVNSDPILHNVHGTANGVNGPTTLFNIAQPVKGQRSTLPSPLDKPGIVFLSCEAGHPWMSANILVSDHPYAAITDSNGGFTISDVPVGTYRLKMWHEGVALVGNNEKLQRYDYEEPYEIVREVPVEEGHETVVDFSLALRT